MRARLRVNASIRNAQPLDRSSIHQVLLDDLGRILGFYAAIPHGFGIDDNRGPVLALVQAQRFVDADIRQAGSLGKLLQLAKDFALSIGSAGGAGCSLGANVMADKDVMLVKRQSVNPPDSRVKVSAAEELSTVARGGPLPSAKMEL
jgi:hypothetical protein